MVGPTNKDEEIRRALKVAILKEREQQRLEDEAEAEKTRKKLELDQKKLKEETECKAIKDKLAEVIKRQEKLKQNRVKVLEHLKKVVQDPVIRQNLLPDEIDKLNSFGVVVTQVPPVPSQPVYITSVPTTVIPRASTVSVNSQYKSTPPIPVQSLPTQKRSRSPSPYHPAYNYKQAAGPHAFQKFEETHRSHDYGRGYGYKPASSIQSSSYNPFYGAAPSVPYTHPSSSVHSNAPVYSSYSTGREDTLHKSQPQVLPPHTAPQHASMYTSHRSSLPPGPSSSMQSSNHVSYLVEKAGPSYPDDKYGMVRPSSHVVHGGPISIQQPPPANKHGSISSGYPVRPVATQIVPPSQLHIQQSHGGHHGSQLSHHSTQPPQHHSSISHHSGPSHQSHQTHHPSAQQSQSHLSQSQSHLSQSQSHLSQSHLSQSHHPQSSIHYPPHSQPQLHHSSSQQQHSSSQPPVSIQSHHSSQHHQQHLQQLHVSAHHPAPGSHHQLLSHHPSSIHHTSSQQHMHPALQHHQQVLQQSHPQQMHHQQMGQPHIQQHISSHQAHQSHMQGQQSQPTSVVTSQYANQINAIQGGSRLVYSQPH